jgi:hypothetical protein
MADLIEKTFHWLKEQLSGRVSRPGKCRYVAATAIWATPVCRTPRAVVHCQTPEDVHMEAVTLGVKVGYEQLGGVSTAILRPGIALLPPQLLGT